MKKNKYTEFLTGVTPDASLKENLINEINQRNNKQPHSFTKVLAIAAVVFVITVCSLIVSAKEELIDFKALFPKYFKVESEQLVPIITGSANDIKASVSDEDYQISLKTIMGDEKSIIAVFELSRKDASPVAKHLLTDIGSKGMRSDFQGYFKSDSSISGQNIRSDIYINEIGNVEYAIRLDCDKASKLDSQIFYAEANKLISVQKEVEIYESFEGVEQEELNQKLQEAVLLDVSWSAEFKYKAPDTPPKTLICTDKKPICTLSDEGTKAIEESGIFSVYSKGEYQAEIVDMSFSSLIGTITFKFPYADEYFNYGAELNHCYLTKKDGSCLSICPVGAYPIIKGGICTLTCKYVYSEGYTSELLIDTSEIASVSINETLYTLG